MWSSPEKQEPIEKMRKAQWTGENTAKTQAVCDDLDAQRLALRSVTGDGKVVEAMTAALKRLRQLDPNVVLRSGS